MKEFCNPLNLNYKYQHYGAYAHREGAEPHPCLVQGTLLPVREHERRVLPLR